MIHYVNFAPMHGNDGLAEIQTEAQTPLAIRFPLPGSVEQIKQMLFGIIRNSRAIISDFYLHDISFFYAT